MLMLMAILIVPKTTGAFLFWPPNKQQQQTRTSATTGECQSSTKATIMGVTVFENGDSHAEGGRSVLLSNQDCRADIASIICNRLNQSAGCTLHDGQGGRVDDCNDIHDGAVLWMVPKGRLFMWPTFEIGHSVQVRNVPSPVPGRKVTLETLSADPKIFRVYNFFSDSESEELIRNALAATDDQFRLKRSSTGNNGYHQDVLRTSENAFDTSSEVAMRLKRRAFNLLGIFPYDETLADGLQILRYNQTTAYVDHFDWMEPDLASGHDYDSGANGTNRYATILLYLSDVEDGGETLFSLAAEESIAYLKGQKFDAGYTPVTSEEAQVTASSYLEQRNVSHLFPETSWQRTLITNCRSRLALRPRRAEAILFYSQLPDGSPDRNSLHAGCPVLEGQKWAANLWVWNGPRHGYWRTNFVTGKREKVVVSEPTPSVTAIFTAAMEGGALYWEDSFWSNLTPGVDTAVSTYGGHRWNVRQDGAVVASWVISHNKPVQRFSIKARN